jgi:single-strand DNA-binding protein
MASFNKVLLIGRLTRDPEMRTFANGGKVANFSVAVNERKKNAQTGAWEDAAIFIDCAAFNRGEYGKTADLIEKFCHKGDLVHVDGKLTIESWDDRTTGHKRTKPKVVVEAVQFLTPKSDGTGSPGGYGGGSRPQSGQRPAGSAYRDQTPSDTSGQPLPDDEPEDQSGGGDQIPF